MNDQPTNVSLSPELMAKVAGQSTDQERYELELPSGRKAQILRRGTGKHVERASRMAGDGAGSIALSMAMVAVKAKVDGRDLTLEDVRELEDVDVLRLIGAVMGKAPDSPSGT